MIRKFEVKNFTVFSHAVFSFGKKLNVIIGENGSGKTHLIKLLYSLLRGCMKQEDSTSDMLSLRDVPQAFRLNIEAAFHDKLVNMIPNKKDPATGLSVVFSFAESSPGSEIVWEWSPGIFSAKKDPMLGNEWLKNEPVFVPAHELLTIYPNFISIYDRYKVGYDSTYRNLISLLGMPELRTLPEDFSALVNTINKKIGADIYLDAKENRFFMKEKGVGKKIGINLAAEGWRRLGILTQLIRNGSLHADVSMFWDEPEANLNPRLIRLMAEVIVDLSKLGIQVFLATHSLFLLREIDMLVKGEKDLREGDVRYFNFLKKGKIEQGDTPEDLGEILLLDESLKQSDRYLEGDF